MGGEPQVGGEAQEGGGRCCCWWRGSMLKGGIKAWVRRRVGSSTSTNSSRSVDVWTEAVAGVLMDCGGWLECLSGVRGRLKAGGSS